MKEQNKNKTIGVDAFCDRLDEIFKAGMITKAQVIEAYNKSVGEAMPTEEERHVQRMTFARRAAAFDGHIGSKYSLLKVYEEWFRNRMGKKFDGNKSVDETMPTGPRFLSPSPLEREWQEHCLKMMFPDYPNVCSWQVLNSLIINASRGTELGIPEYDEWFRNRMINDCL